MAGLKSRESRRTLSVTSLDVADHFVAFLFESVLVGAQALANRAQLKLQDDEGLSQFVVQFNRKPPSLIFLGSNRLGRQMMQLPFRVPQGLLCFLAVGNVSCDADGPLGLSFLVLQNGGGEKHGDPFPALCQIVYFPIADIRSLHQREEIRKIKNLLPLGNETLHLHANKVGFFVSQNFTRCPVDASDSAIGANNHERIVNALYDVVEIVLGDSRLVQFHGHPINSIGQCADLIASSDHKPGVQITAGHIPDCIGDPFDRQGNEGGQEVRSYPSDNRGEQAKDQHFSSCSRYFHCRRPHSRLHW